MLAFVPELLLGDVGGGTLKADASAVHYYVDAPEVPGGLGHRRVYLVAEADIGGQEDALSAGLTDEPERLLARLGPA